MITTIEISLELIAVVLIFVITVLVGYFCIFLPFSQEYTGSERIPVLVCPHCGSSDLEYGWGYYYCCICDKKLKRKVK